MNRGFCKEQKPLFQPNKVNFRRRISAEASAEDHRRSLGRSRLRFNTDNNVQLHEGKGSVVLWLQGIAINLGPRGQILL